MALKRKQWNQIGFIAVILTLTSLFVWIGFANEARCIESGGIWMRRPGSSGSKGGQCMERPLAPAR